MLLRLPPEGIQKLLDNYEKTVSSIKKNAMSMSWSMRGGMSYMDILNMSASERSFIKEIIDKNVEITKSTGIPYF